MSGFWPLFLDELRRLSRTRFFAWLFTLMPLLIIVLPLLLVNDGAIPVTTTVGMFVPLACTVIACVLASTLTNDINNKVFVPFLVRPVSIFSVLLSRIAALVIPIISTISISLLVVNIILANFYPSVVTDSSLMYVTMISFAELVFSVAIGTLIGVFVPSSAAGILVCMFFCWNVVICISLGSEKLSIWLWGRAQAGMALILVSLIVTAIVLAVAPKKFKERVL
ncbi:MAG: hypothetical protein FWG12_00035 [Holophagaceae bacterium]|nr:hypothetical protein [Holophagaceae bacterium]